MDRYDQDTVTAWTREDGTVRLEVEDGPLRISRLLVTTADPRLLSREGDVVTLHGVDDDGTAQRYRYRITGREQEGPEDGWYLCEPIPDAA